MMISPGVFFIFSKFWFSGLLGGREGGKRDHAKYDCHLWWAKVQLLYLQVFFFSKFCFFGLVGGSKDKKWPKMTKNSVLCTLYLRNHTSYDLDLWYTCLKGNISRCIISSCVLHFFQILIFGVNSGVKDQKMA